MKKILVLFYPGCIEYEVMLALELVGRESEVSLVINGDEPLRGSSGIQFLPDLRVEEALMNHWDAILIPGGDPGTVIQNQLILDLVRNIFEANGIVAAICAGPLVPAAAGVARGKSIAHGYMEEQLDFLKEYFLGVETTSEMLIQDGNLLTAKPQAAIPFGVRFAKMLGLVEYEEELISYYRGVAP